MRRRRKIRILLILLIALLLGAGSFLYMNKSLRPVLVADAHTSTDTAVLSARQIIDHHNATLQAFARVVRTADCRFR